MTTHDLHPTPIRRRASVVVGVDGSNEAVHALAWAVDHAVDNDLDVEVITTWTFPTIGVELPSTGRRLHAGALAVAAHAVDVVADDRRERGLEMPPVHTEAFLAHPADRLIASSRGAALLVVGRGRRAVLGSTSRAVTHHATCPVAVIPGVSGDAASDSLTRRLGAEHPKIAAAVDAVSRHLSAMGI